MAAPSSSERCPCLEKMAELDGLLERADRVFDASTLEEMRDEFRDFRIWCDQLSLYVLGRKRDHKFGCTDHTRKTVVNRLGEFDDKLYAAYAILVGQKRTVLDIEYSKEDLEEEELLYGSKNTIPSDEAVKDLIIALKNWAEMCHDEALKAKELPRRTKA